MYGNIVVGLVAVLTAPLEVPQVHKCTENGQTTYQSQPCTGQSLAHWSVAPALARKDPEIERRNQELLEQMRQQWRRPAGTGVRRKPTTAGSGAGRPRQTRPAPSACEKARSDQQTAYQRLGLKRTFAQSRYWDGVVFDACK